MIDLRQMNQGELEQFERRMKKGFYQRGVRIVYHEGNAGDTVGSTILGKLAQKLAGYGNVNCVDADKENSFHRTKNRVSISKDAKVDLFQKKLGVDNFQYWMVVK